MLFSMSNNKITLVYITLYEVMNYGIFTETDAISLNELSSNNQV